MLYYIIHFTGSGAYEYALHASIYMYMHNLAYFVGLIHNYEEVKDMLVASIS